MSLETAVPAHDILFGDTSIPAVNLSWEAEQPFRTVILCDGTVQHRMLSETACTLTLTGFCNAQDGLELCSRLSRKMRRHDREQFLCEQTVFCNMQITKLAYRTCRQKMITEFSVTMVGTMKEEAES